MTGETAKDHLDFWVLRAAQVQMFPWADKNWLPEEKWYGSL